MLKIQIPKPCHAEWSEMTPTRQGAFCSSCSKEVIDFTEMSDEEVKNYFLQTSTGSTCGRFRTEQIHRIRISLPDNIFIQRIAGWKKFMAVVMLAFGSMLFGCDVDLNKRTAGEVQIQTAPHTKLLGDTTMAIDTTQLLGKMAMPMGAPAVVESKQENCNVMTGAVAPIEHPVMGEIALMPDTSVQPVVDTTAYDKISIMPPIKKPASDTGKCKDPGYY